MSDEQNTQSAEQMTQQTTETDRSDEAVNKTPETPSSNESLVDKIAQPPEWRMNSETKGVGDKPKYLLDKFKSVEDQLKSFVELEKKLGSRTGAPKEYKLPEHVDKESELTKSLVELGKELSLNQDGMDKILSMADQYRSELVPEVSIEEEIAKLTDDDKTSFKEIMDTVLNNIDPAEQEAMKDYMTKLVPTADQLKAFLTVTNTLMSQPIAAMESSHIERPYYYADYLKDFNNPNYSNDEKFRKTVEKRLDEAVKSGSISHSELYD